MSLKWYAAKAGNDHQGLVIEEDTGRNVAVAYDRADGPLLAAAPDLLAALRDVLGWFDTGDFRQLMTDKGEAALCHKLINASRKAIYRAEGGAA